MKYNIDRDWQKYPISVNDLNSRNSNGSPFETVSHITHFEDAFRILEDKQIRSSLIWDESKLNNSRTTVSWVSPNSWAYGSIYGSVGFEYEWDKLISGKNLYWVEVKHYGTKAFRILAADDVSKIKSLVSPYDPEADDGPLRFYKNQWFYRNDMAAELIIDSDLQLTQCLRVTCVKHHTNTCKKNRYSCPDLDLAEYKAYMRLLAFIIGKEITSSNSLFMEDGKISLMHQDGLNRLLNKIEKNVFFTSSCNNNPQQQKDLIEASLYYYSQGDISKCFNLLSMFSDIQEFKTSFNVLVNEHF